MKKLTAEQFYFSEAPWFTVTICEDTGTVDVQSDHGDYCHKWRGQAGKLKSFLASTGTDYIYDKFGYASMGRDSLNSWFNGEKTAKRILTDITRAFVDGSISEYDFNALSDGVEEIAAENQHSFMYTLPDDLLEKVYGNDWAALPSVREVHPQLAAFMEKCWPRFVEELKNE